MVMPCSRSASRPSVSSDRSSSSLPRLCEARSTAASWSSRIARLSCSSRPISVLLPSSTLPAVMKRNTPSSADCVPAWLRSISPSMVMVLEISFFLAPLHGGIGGLVVHPGRAALGHGHLDGLGNDGFHRGGLGFDRAGAAHVADSAEAHAGLLDALALPRRR